LNNVRNSGQSKKVDEKEKEKEKGGGLVKYFRA